MLAILSCWADKRLQLYVVPQFSVIVVLACSLILAKTHVLCIKYKRIHKSKRTRRKITVLLNRYLNGNLIGLY